MSSGQTEVIGFRRIKNHGFAPSSGSHFMPAASICKLSLSLTLFSPPLLLLLLPLLLPQLVLAGRTTELQIFLRIHLRQVSGTKSTPSLFFKSLLPSTPGFIDPQKVSCTARRIWRRRKLSKEDEKSGYSMDRVPFLEEQVRRIRASGKIMSLDIERLLLSEENRFDFVNEVAAEAKACVERSRDEYGFKKPILHVLSNRMNDAGFRRSEAYMEEDPFKPGPNYLRIPET